MPAIPTSYSFFQGGSLPSWRDRRMNRALIALVGVTCLLAVSSAEAQPRRRATNVVLIMADDMGYTDIGCYGGEIQTPVLDRLARNGLRFSQFYNTSRCCPTRAALLTGLYSHQAGVGLMMDDLGFDAYRGDLNRRCITLAEALRPAGYRNYMSGKWHVTRHAGPRDNNANWPLQRGFDRFYGTITGAGSFYDPATLCRDNTFITPENDPEYQPDEFYYTDAISENAANYIDDHVEQHPDQPFFLYVAYTSAHWPMHAPAAEIAKYKGVYSQGYDPIRTARHQRAIEQGVLDASWTLSPTVGDWESTPHQEWETRCMEVYAAMVDRMDQGIGKIVSRLEQHRRLDNTLIIYLQDNGGCAEGLGRRSNAGQRQNFNYQPFGPDDLQPRITPPMQTRAGRWVQTGPEVLPGPEDTYVAYGQNWANVSNTPFRGYKHDGYEGGISTPCIAHWPVGIADQQRGRVVSTPAHLIDVMPTLLDITGVNYPTEFNGSAIQPSEGVSLLPALVGETVTRTAPLCFEHHGNLALRDGRWKIVSEYRPQSPRTWELYDIDADRTEQHNLASQQPEKLQALVTQWQTWADRVGVQPWPIEKPGSK